MKLLVMSRVRPKLITRKSLYYMFITIYGRKTVPIFFIHTTSGIPTSDISEQTDAVSLRECFPLITINKNT